MRAAPRAARGSLLVITLWIMVILGALAVAVGRQLSMEIRLTKYRRALDQARTLARSGVLLAMARLQDDARQQDEPYDWLQDDWAVFPASGPEGNAEVWVVPVPTDERGASSSGGRVEIEIRDQERKMDVNTIPVEALGPLIGSPMLAQAIVDYRDSDSALESPVETPPYYYPKDGPIIAIEELQDLPEMTADAFDALQRTLFAVPQSNPATTVKVNINTAGLEVLQAAGLTMALAEAIVLFRDQGYYFTSLSPVQTNDPAGPPSFVTDTEFITAQPQLGVASQMFTVSVTSYVDAPAVRQHLEAVVQRTPGGEPPRVIAWRES